VGNGWEERPTQRKRIQKNSRTLPLVPEEMRDVVFRLVHQGPAAGSLVLCLVGWARTDA